MCKTFKDKERVGICFSYCYLSVTVKWVCWTSMQVMLTATKINIELLSRHRFFSSAFRSSPVLRTGTEWPQRTGSRSFDSPRAVSPSVTSLTGVSFIVATSSLATQQLHSTGCEREGMQPPRHAGDNYHLTNPPSCDQTWHSWPQLHSHPDASRFRARYGM